MPARDDPGTTVLTAARSCDLGRRADGSCPMVSGDRVDRGSAGEGWFFREAEDPLGEDVAHHVRRAAHDRVAGRVGQAGGDRRPQRRLGPEHAGDELGDPPLVLGAEALGRRREPTRRLAEHLAHHQDAADSIPGLELRDRLPNERVVEVGSFERGEVQGAVRHEPVDAAPLVLELLHRLLERASLDADQVGHRHPYIVVEHLAEVPVSGHVGDRPDLDTSCIHRDDDLADPGVGRPLGRRATDQVAVVGHLAEARPDLLPVDHPLVAVPPGRARERRQVGAGVRLGHADAPGRLTGEDPRQERRLLRRCAVGDQRRAHLAIGEPHRRDRGTRRDHLLGHDQPVDRRPPASSELGRPGHPDPSDRPELTGELLREPVDPGVVLPPVPRHRGLGHPPGLGAQLVLLGRPGEVHQIDCTSRAAYQTRSGRALLFLEAQAGEEGHADGERTHLDRAQVPRVTVQIEPAVEAGRHADIVRLLGVHGVGMPRGRLTGAPSRVVGRAVPAVPSGSTVDLRRRRHPHSRRVALRLS